MGLLDCTPDRWVEALADPSWSHTVEYVARRWERSLCQQEAARSAVPLPPDWALPVGADVPEPEGGDPGIPPAEGGGDTV
eukprot:9774788-Prorocentrum_lima.AAC.1